MNLHWLKRLGILNSTNKYERKELAFLASCCDVDGGLPPTKWLEYKKLLLEYKFATINTQKQLKSRLDTLSQHPEVSYFLQKRGNQSAPPTHQLTFRDEFDGHSTQPTVWQPGFHLPQNSVKKQYSFENEKQWYNGGKNTFFGQNTLRIFTRKETVDGTAWHPTKGFVTQLYHYTSDVVNSADAFQQCGGVFRVKVRCTGLAHHAVWLGTIVKQPHITLFQAYENTVKMGYVNNNEGDAVTLSGLNPSEYHIFSVEWTAHQLVFSVNNLVVLKCTQHIPWEPMYIACNSFLPANEQAGEGLLEVDWIHVYQHIV